MGVPLKTARGYTPDMPENTVVAAGSPTLEPIEGAPKPDWGTPLEAPIAAVEVFRASALVHRLGRIEAGGASARYAVAGLPLGLVDASVRVSLDPVTPSCSVVDLQVALDVETPVEEAQLEEVQRYRELERRASGLNRRRERLLEEGGALMKLVPVLPPPPKRPDQERFGAEDPLPGWLALGEVTRQAADEKLRRARELEQQLERLDDELKQARDRLEQLSSAKLAQLQIGKRVELRLSAPPAAPLEVRLSYQVPGARWFPSYELRVDHEGSRAELVMSALLAQVTGEDWRDVALSLSTADLRRRCDLPRLGAWRVGRTRSQERRLAWRELPPDLPQLFVDFDRQLPVEPQPPPRPELKAAAAPRQEAIHGMIAEALGEARRPPPPPAQPASLPAQEYQRADYDKYGKADYDKEEDGFSPAEITRESLELAEELEQAFEDEPTPTSLLALAAPAPERAAAPMRSAAAKRRSARLRRDEVPEPAKHGAPAPGETSLRPAEDLLAFGNLVLASGRERGRGMLRPLKLAEQLDPERRAPEVLAAIERAEEGRAARVLSLRGLVLPSGVREVADSAGHFAHRYDTRLTAGLPADGALHRFAVLRRPVSIEMVYRTVPAADTAVYRVARLVNPLERPLLAGPLDVFWGNDFLVTARLETTAHGAAIEANLGVEPRIKVARNVRHSQHEEGLLAGRTVYEDEIRVEVQNGLGQAATVEVLERLPVTEERKVEVKRLEEQPPGEAYEQKDRHHPIRGGRRWRLRLEPGARQGCLLRYSVSVPSSSEIVGGGRRG